MNYEKLTIIILASMDLCICVPFLVVNIKYYIKKSKEDSAVVTKGFDKLTEGYPEYRANEFDFKKLSFVGTLMGTVFGIAAIFAAFLFH